MEATLLVITTMNKVAIRFIPQLPIIQLLEYCIICIFMAKSLQITCPQFYQKVRFGCNMVIAPAFGKGYPQINDTHNSSVFDEINEAPVVHHWIYKTDDYCRRYRGGNLWCEYPRLPPFPYFPALF